MEHTVIDDLEHLIVEMAREEAHHHQCSLAEATRQIRALLAEARGISRGYTPYGDEVLSLAAHKTTPDAECLVSDRCPVDTAISLLLSPRSYKQKCLIDK
jgi:hypothetical protein